MQSNKDFWLKSTPIAHRGLWGGEIKENSLAAYSAAVQHGFAIEIDLYTSTDGVIYSFHDKNLKRMTGFDGLIYEQTSTVINSLTLNGSDQKIPTLDEVLSLVDGRVPLLIELKDQPDKSYVDKVVDVLKSYKGEFAVQSFNPLYIKKVKNLAPEFTRGILGTNLKAHASGAFTRFIVKRMPLNFIVKPHFISYYHLGFPLPKRKVKDKILLAWTIKSQQNANTALNFADNIIFEEFIPNKK